MLSVLLKSCCVDPIKQHALSLSQKATGNSKNVLTCLGKVITYDKATATLEVKSLEEFPVQVKPIWSDTKS